MATENTGDADGPRLAITDDDRSAFIIVVTATLVAWTVVVLTIRVASKLSARITVGLEEVAVILSSVLAIACSATIFAGVKFGLGKSEDIVSEEDDISVSKALYAADLLYIFTLWLSKGATILLTYRLTKLRQHLIACYALGGFVSAWALASVFVVAIRQNTSQPWLDRSTDTEPSLLARWVTVEAISLSIEVMILALATYIILMLQMPLNKKFKGIFAFMTRLPLIAPIALRLMYLKSGFEGSNFTLDITNAVITTQCAMHYTVMAASFAYLKPFLAAFDSNLGATVKLDTTMNTSGASARAGASHQLKSGGSYNMKPLSQNVVTSQTDSRREDKRRQRDSSQDSNAPIIMKTQTFEVRSEIHRPGNDV